MIERDVTHTMARPTARTPPHTRKPKARPPLVCRILLRLGLLGLSFLHSSRVKGGRHLFVAPRPPIQPTATSLVIHNKELPFLLSCITFFNFISRFAFTRKRTVYTAYILTRSIYYIQPEPPVLSEDTVVTMTDSTTPPAATTTNEKPKKPEVPIEELYDLTQPIPKVSDWMNHRGL